MHDITAINANLLVALDALLAERSVTKAARRLGVTQPAMSNTLAKLRAFFDDPLLVREGRGMVPTSLAERLRGPLQRGVGGLREALQRAVVFDPATADLRVTIAASDFAQSTLIAPLQKALAQHAPGMRVAWVHAAHYEDFEAVRAGEADCFVGFAGEGAEDIVMTPLFEARLVGIARRDHPTLGDLVTAKAYARCGHVVVTESPGSPTGVDRALAGLGLQRRVAVTVPHFLQVPELVAGSDLVAAVNQRTARYYAPRLGLRWFELPVETRPGSMRLAWNARTNADPAHAWFRERCVEAVGKPEASMPKAPES